MPDELLSPQEPRFCDVVPALEFICWTVVVLTPLLRLINGAAVTDDQFVIQVCIFAAALLGGIALRSYQIFGR